jgi:hypothetical protein
MPFKPGESGNPNGRPKGAIGKNTQEWEDLKSSIVGRHTDKFNQILDQASGDKFVDYYLRALEYIMPKQARTEIVDETEKKLIIEIDRGEGQNKFEESSPSAAGNIS